jgi:CubicO group peptidase (beta-lactamase class C family)
MTVADLSTEMNSQKSHSMLPIHLSGGGAGADTTFIGIWAQQDQPTPRSWRATGTATGFKNIPSAINAVDTVVQTFMRSAGVRQAQVSVGKGGNILLERAYSWSESTRHTTQPNDIFLLASISKMFCCAAIQSLYNRRFLSSTDKVYAKLGYTGTPTDQRVNDITVQDLVDHKGGDDLSKNHIDTVFYSADKPQGHHRLDVQARP